MLKFTKRRAVFSVTSLMRPAGALTLPWTTLDWPTAPEEGARCVAG